jgi:hypothetical protein
MSFCKLVSGLLYCRPRVCGPKRWCASAKKRMNYIHLEDVFLPAELLSLATRVRSMSGERQGNTEHAFTFQLAVAVPSDCCMLLEVDQDTACFLRAAMSAVLATARSHSCSSCHQVGMSRSPTGHPRQLQ